MTPYQKKKELMHKDYESRIKKHKAEFEYKKGVYEDELSGLTKDLRLLKLEFEEFLKEQEILNTPAIVRLVNQSDPPMKAYIVQKDFSDKEARTAFVSNLRNF